MRAGTHSRRDASGRRARDDAGVGLVEVLVSMLMFGIVLTAVTAVFTNVLETSRLTSAKTSTTADTRIAMEAMTRSLRVAYQPTGEASAFLHASPTRVEFYASLARGAGQTEDRPTKVTYAYDAVTGCLNETQVVAQPTGVLARPLAWPGAGTTKCLIRTNTPPAFSYFADGRIAAPDGSTIAPLAVPTAGYSSTDATGLAVLDDVVSVEMSLDVQDPEVTDVNGVQARDRVTLTNVLNAQRSGD